MIGSATMEAFIAAGLSPDQMLVILRAMEKDAAAVAPQKSPAAVRQQRYRNARRNDRDVTGDVTPPPNDNISNPPVPSSDEDGAVSDETRLWSTGRAMLVKLGVPKSQAGSVIGKWKKAHGIGETIEALAAADRESRMNGGLVEPIGFIEGVFRHRAEPDRPIC